MASFCRIMKNIRLFSPTTVIKGFCTKPILGLSKCSQQSASRYLQVPIVSAFSLLKNNFKLLHSPLMMPSKSFSCVPRCCSNSHDNYSSIMNRSLLNAQSPYKESIRTVIKFSIKRGKRKTVHAVINRFYRLQSGVWIRPRSGRQRRLYKKNKEMKYILRQHVFCNKTQSIMLDKMVADCWKEPKYYVDDPYEPYHVRHNYRYVPRRR